MSIGGELEKIRSAYLRLYGSESQKSINVLNETAGVFAERAGYPIQNISYPSPVIKSMYETGDGEITSITDISYPGTGGGEAPAESDGAVEGLMRHIAFDARRYSQDMTDGEE